MLATKDELSLTPEVGLMQELPVSHKPCKLQKSSLLKLQLSSQIPLSSHGCQNPNKVSSAILWAMHVAILTTLHCTSLL